MQGKIKFYNKIRGFGFITAAEHIGEAKKHEYFFHVRELPPEYEPQADEDVIFELGENKQGVCAVKIQKK